MSEPSGADLLALVREHAEIRCRTCGAHDVEIIPLPPKPPAPPLPDLGPGEHRGFEHGPDPEPVLEDLTPDDQEEA